MTRFASPWQSNRRVPIFAAVAALVAVGFVVVTLLTDGDDPSPGSDLIDIGTTQPTPTMVELPPKTPTPPQTSPVTTITQLSIPAGGVVPEGWGIVLGNRLTGGAELWLMPGGTEAKGISPLGRYFVYEDELFDGWTGKRVVINDGPGGIVLASFSPNDQFVYVQSAGLAGRVLRLDGSEVVALPEFCCAANALASILNVVWTPDGRGLAVTRLAGTRQRTDVVIGGELQAQVEPAGMTSWSNDGLRLAVSTKSGTTIMDYESGQSQAFAAGGNFPAWSGDDSFLAVDITEQESRALSVLDASSGVEVLRAYNASACFDLYWAGDRLLAGSTGKAVEVPSGALEADAPAPFTRFPRFEQTSEHIRWMDEGGVYAEVGFSQIWAYSASWLRRDIDGWPPVVGLGRGGKGICAYGGPEPVVVFPPFTPDKIPTPTATSAR